MHLRIDLNGAPAGIEAIADEPLLSVLRRLGVHGCRLACGIGVCGTCTAEVNGKLVATCIYPAAKAEGSRVTTVEGLQEDDPTVAAFVAHTAVQCGFCTPGMVLTARNLIADPQCGDAEVVEGMAGNLCRCGSYDRAAAAVQDAIRAGNGAETREMP